MPKRIWMPSPCALLKDVEGDIQGVLLDVSQGEAVCWHVEVIDDIRTITGYTIVQRISDEELQSVASRSR
jgi:hypothetical protein